MNVSVYKNNFEAFNTKKVLYIGPIDMALNKKNTDLLNLVLEYRVATNHLSKKMTSVTQYKNYMVDDFSYLNQIDSLKSKLKRNLSNLEDNAFIVIYDEYTLEEIKELYKKRKEEIEILNKTIDTTV